MHCAIIPPPQTPIGPLAVEVRNFLHLPDPSSLYVLYGAVAANMFEGPPCWLMLVGPPSCGKSEILNTLLDIPHMISGADISGEAAFLSGSNRRERASDATGGILRQIGDHGGVVLNDFTSVLSKPTDKFNPIMSVFREAFVGEWTRQIGGEGGRILTWKGRLALFAGVTGRIDQHHQVSAELGERWIYWRYDTEPGSQYDDHFAETMMALSSNRVNGWRD